MSQVKPIDLKVNIKPVFAQLIHSDAYEGPCRTGRREELTPESDRARGQEQFRSFVKELKDNLGCQAQLMKPVYMEWGDDFVIPESEVRKVEPEIYQADLVLVAHSGLPQYPAIRIAERYRKPVGMIGWIAPLDVAAYLRSRGLEGYAFLDFHHLNHFISLFRVRKAMQQSRFLLAMKGNLIPTGVVSSIWDIDGLRKRYGVDFTYVTAEEVIGRMQDLPDDALTASEQLTDRLIRNAAGSHMTRENLLPSVKFYIATKQVMEKYGCNGFVIPCFEICASRIAEKLRATFCLTHTLLKDEGLPSACEGDVNVLMTMALLMYLSRRSAYMGNAYEVNRKENILAVHHDVPGLKMKGLDEPDLPYELVNFTQEGWGATVRYDISRDLGEPVTLARFNPAGTRLLVAAGKVAGCEGLTRIGCSLSYHVNINDVEDLFKKEQDFGHHLALVYGNYVSELCELGALMGFEVVKS